MLNVVDAVKNDFTVKHTDADNAQVNAFCEFMKTWLTDKKIIGVGQAVDGFAVRFADLSEFLLTGNDNAGEINSAVSISGSSGRSDRTAVDNSSVGITTGR